jgi:peptide/nickel transport system permease protein
MPTSAVGRITRLPASTLVGGVLVGLFVLVALFGPLFAPFDPAAQNLDKILQGPSAQHVLGTDQNGCDVLSELLYGARLALFIAGTVVVISFIVGVFLGCVAGYLGGVADEVTMRVVDLLLAFPGILLNLAVVAMVRRPSTFYLIFALCLNGWVGFARMARGQVLAIKRQDFVLAARASGAGPGRVLFRHILPHILPPLMVQASFAFAAVVLTEASLSFLGLGPPVHYSWGSLLGQGTAFLWLSHHLAVVPGLAIALVVLGCNLLGDGLQDRLSPQRTR